MPPETHFRPAAGAVRHAEHVWGTVVSFDVRDAAVCGADEADIRDAIADACTWLHEVDRIFSTYRDDSLVSAIRRGDAADELEQDFSAYDRRLMAEVMDGCEQFASFTDGVFDAWNLPGGFDPSGYVKGWAAGEAASLLADRGLRFFLIDAGGDLVCRGGESEQDPWHIGIRHPDRADQVMATLEVRDGAVATSGIYERGHHVYDTAAKAFSTAARAATVVGPDVAAADAMATTLLIRGEQLLPLLAQMPGGVGQWSALVVAGDRVTSIGSAFG